MIAAGGATGATAAIAPRFDLAAAAGATGATAAIAPRFDLTAAGGATGATAAIAPRFDLGAAWMVPAALTVALSVNLDVARAAAAGATPGREPDLLGTAELGACAIAEHMPPSPMTPIATRYGSLCIALSLISRSRKAVRKLAN